MCGRYVLAEEPNKIYGRYKLSKKAEKDQLNFYPLYNIAPGYLVPVITGDGKKRLEIMKWGLIPHWADEPKIGYKLINARAETVDKKPSFKSSFKNKRCLIPATGFYEWQKTTSEKIPYLVQMRSRKIFSMAGIYDVWQDAEGKKIKTFSIITTKPNKLLENIHNRMPVLLEEDNESLWLSSKAPAYELKSLLKPFSNQKLTAYTVSKEVNKPENDGPNLLHQVSY